MKVNHFLAVLIILAVLLLFAYVIALKIGGEKALFLIIGHLAAWAEIVVIFYYRKAPEKK